MTSDDVKTSYITFANIYIENNNKLLQYYHLPQRLFGCELKKRFLSLMTLYKLYIDCHFKAIYFGQQVLESHGYTKITF